MTSTPVIGRKATVAAVSSALCIFLVTLYALRFDESSEQIPEKNTARDESIDREQAVDVTRVGTSRRVENGDLEEPRGPATISLPAPMAQALESMGARVQPSSPAVESERAFSAEPDDPYWAREMEARITGEVGPIVGSRLVTLHVRV